jgi:hypothetical protein
MAGPLVAQQAELPIEPGQRVRLEAPALFEGWRVGTVAYASKGCSGAIVRAYGRSCRPGRGHPARKDPHRSCLLVRETRGRSLLMRTCGGCVLAAALNPEWWTTLARYPQSPQGRSGPLARTFGRVARVWECPSGRGPRRSFLSVYGAVFRTGR